MLAIIVFGTGFVLALAFSIVLNLKGYEKEACCIRDGVYGAFLMYFFLVLSIGFLPIE